MQIFNSRRHLLAGLGALALAVMLMLGGPSAAAHAASPPDFMTVLQAASWNSGKGQPFKFVAFYKRKTASNGPAKVTIYVQQGFGNPTIANAAGFNCSKSFQAAGWFPGWHITCTKPSITPGGGWFDAIEIHTTAPTAAGDFVVLSNINPASGPDLNSSDNQDYKKLHVN